MAEYKIVLTDAQTKILEHDLLDIQAWVDGAVAGKINNCLKRAAREFRETLKREGAASMPVTDEACFEALTARPTYRSRKGREEDARIEQDRKRAAAPTGGL